MLTIISLFRDREQFIPQYISQVEYLPFKVDVVCVENDSKDKTREMLENWKKNNKKRNLKVHIVGEETGEKYYPSMVDPERFRILATACNLGFDYAYKKLKNKYFMFVESDLIWTKDNIQDLIDTVTGKDMLLSPYIWTEKDKVFYDFWAFRYLVNPRKEEHFPATKMDWYDKNWGKGPDLINSSGSCIVGPHEALKYRLTNEEAIVGFSKAAGKEYPTYVSRVDIYHPQ